MKLKLENLVKLRACWQALDLFENLFGKEVELTLDLCLEHGPKFDMDWAAENLLKPEARAEYEKAQAPAWAECEKARAAAWAEYRKARAPAWAEYEKAQAAAFAEYEKAQAPAWAEYEKAQATAFFNAWSMRGVK